MASDSVSSFLRMLREQDRLLCRGATLSRRRRSEPGLCVGMPLTPTLSPHCGEREGFPLRLVVREPHRRGAGAVGGLDVDAGDHAVIDLLLRALQGRADLFRPLDIFAPAAERLGHLVVARIAEIAPR